MTSPPSFTAPLPESQDTDERPVYLGISLIWDDAKLPTYAEGAYHAFRDKFPEISFHHFIEPSSAAAEAKRFIREGDTIGLYLAPQQDKTSTSIWGEERSQHRDETSLQAYSDEEILSFAVKGKKALEVAFGRNIDEAMTSDWTTSSGIAAALAGAGFSYDFSPIPPSYLRSRLQNFPLFAKIASSWPEVTPFSLPFRGERYQDLIYVPQTAGSIDYVDSKDLEALFGRQSDAQKAGSQKRRLFHISTHLKTLAATLPRLETLFLSVLSQSQKQGLVVRPMPEDIAQIFDKIPISSRY